jgi:outer membrane lipoprotein-sorting protein
MQKHMTMFVLIFLPAVIASLEIRVAAQSQTDRAAAVLADARIALGGQERLNAVKTLQAAGDFRRSMGEMQMEGELEVLLERPDKLRRNEDITMPGGATMTRTEVLNGDQVWDDSGQRGGMGHGMAIVMRGPGGNLDREGISEMQRRMRRADLERYSLAWLLASDLPVSHVGVAEAPDGKADVLEFTPAEGPPIRMFIDQRTHLPLMLTWKGPRPRVMVRRVGGPQRDGGPPAPEGDDSPAPPAEATFEMRLADYRTVDNLQLPHEIMRSIDGQTNEEWTIKSYKVNSPFKSNTFTK